MFDPNLVQNDFCYQPRGSMYTQLVSCTDFFSMYYIHPVNTNTDSSFVPCVLLCMYHLKIVCTCNFQGRKGNRNQTDGAHLKAKEHEQRDGKRLAWSHFFWCLTNCLMVYCCTGGNRSTLMLKLDKKEHLVDHHLIVGQVGRSRARIFI